MNFIAPLRGSWVAIALVVLGSAPSVHSLQTSAAQKGERDIYTALLRDLFQGALPHAFVIQANPLSLLRPSPSDWNWLGPGTAALRAKVETGTAKAAARFTTASFPNGTTLMSKEDLEAFFHDDSLGRSLNERWSDFHERFKVTGFQGFSRPVVSGAGLDALVYYSNSYGSQGGESGYAWLHRASVDAPWTVVKRLPNAVS